MERWQHRLYTKESQPDYLERANKALLAFGKGSYFSVHNSWSIPNASYWADVLLKAGHKDYMDCWIAGTAKVLNLSFVTEDQPLVDTINKIPEWDDETIFSFEDLVEYKKLKE